MKKSDDHLFEDDKAEDHIIRKSCARFHGEDYEHRDFKDAVTYLVLRGEGCPRKDAILFASKNPCRVDTTKEKSGPKDYRTLELQEVPHYMVQSGWLYGQHDFKLGKCIQPRYSKSYYEALNDDKMEDNFNEQEVKMRKEYKEMIKRMKEYVKQINSKYELTNKSGEELVEAVKIIVAGMKKELESRLYLTVNNVRYFDIAETIAHKAVLTEDEKNNLIEKLNVFNNLENEYEFRSQPICKIEEEDAATHLNNNNNLTNAALSPSYLQFQQQQKQLQQNQQQLSSPQSAGDNTPWKIMSEAQRKQQLASVDKSIQYAAQLKNLESATKLLEDFDKTEGDELSKPIGRFDRSYEKKKKIRQAQMKNNLEMVKEENQAQAGIEGQFNQQKYFFTHEEKIGGNLQKEQREKEELQNYVFNTYCQAIDQGFQENYEKFRWIQSQKQFAGDNFTQYSQQNYQQIASSTSKKDGNFSTYQSVGGSQEERNHKTKSTSLCELDMGAILDLKEKQQNQFVSFNSKVQPYRVYRRSKGIIMPLTRAAAKSVYIEGSRPEKGLLSQHNEIDANCGSSQGEFSRSNLNSCASQNQLPNPQIDENVSLRNISSQNIKLRTQQFHGAQPSLREITSKNNLLSAQFPSNQSLQIISPFERFQQLSAKSGSQKQVLLEPALTGNVQNTQAAQNMRKFQHKSNHLSIQNNLESLPSKKQFALTPQGTRMLKGSNMSTTSTRIPSIVFSMNPSNSQYNTTTTPQQEGQQLNRNTNNSSNSLRQIFNSATQTTKPSSNDLSSAYFFPKHKAVDLASISSTPQRKIIRTGHTTATNSVAESIQSFSPPLFKLPSKKYQP